MDVKELINKAGGARKVAEMCGVSHQAVYNWVNIPAPHVLRFSRLLDIPPETIRPDVFCEPQV